MMIGDKIDNHGKNGQYHGRFLRKKIAEIMEESRKKYGKITAKTRQQIAVNSINTRVQSPCSQFLAFTTIIT